jgi:peptidoglycan/LPS O-acetylase OafA/YrhL
LFFVLKSCYSEFKFINKFLENNRVVNIGIVSYGIYILHKLLAYYFDIFIFDDLWNQFDFSLLGRLSILEFHPWILKFPLYFTLSIILAKISFKCFESPLLRLKDRYFKYN